MQEYRTFPLLAAVLILVLVLVVENDFACSITKVAHTPVFGNLEEYGVFAAATNSSPNQGSSSSSDNVLSFAGTIIAAGIGAYAVIIQSVVTENRTLN